MRRFFLRLANLWSGHAEREMTREIDAHLALLQDEFERQGMHKGIFFACAEIANRTSMKPHRMIAFLLGVHRDYLVPEAVRRSRSRNRFT